MCRGTFAREFVFLVFPPGEIPKAEGMKERLLVQYYGWTGQVRGKGRVWMWKRGGCGRNDVEKGDVNVNVDG